MTNPIPLPTIARNKAEFFAALFNSKKTFDGYIIRTLKGGIKLFALGEEYVLNHENVFCLATKQPDGRTWYSYGGKLNKRTLTERYELSEQVRKLAAIATNK